ncbi:MAG: FAD-dependent oxidoreductase [Firmicutes bacterium HGW-Firmicutes-14]|nr:MAG: FAD-dependent oxidoreductase [Firmicutes bacterium HGW-Firmicutes-14]
MAKRVVILGAGYGGVKCAQTLERKSSRDETEIILVNKHDYHQFIAQIHESAVGLRDNEDIRVSLAEIFDETRVRIIKDIVLHILPKENKILLEQGTVTYDYLVVALGSEPEYFNIPGIERHSLTLRSLNSAKLIRTHIENRFAAFKANPLKREFLTIVVGGAGFTGIELAGELADWVHELVKEFDLPENLVSVINIEAASTILKEYDRQLIENAYHVLREKGVRIVTDTSIEEVTENRIELSSGEVIKTGTFIWTGGIRANRVVARSGFTSAVRGRARVNKYLQAVDYPNVYIIGDNAFITDPATGDVMGPTAQVAIQGGYIAAHNIMADARGDDLKVFYPRELGRVVSLGRNVAVGQIGKKFKSKGRVAGLLKQAIQWKYLYSIGGVKLVTKKLLK